MSKQKQEVAKVESTALVPEYLKGYTGPSGAESIQTEDIAIPRIKIAQALSPEVKEGKLAEGDLFLSVTSAVLAEAGAELVVVPLVIGKEYILWRPRQDGGGGLLNRARPVIVNGEQRYRWDFTDQEFEVKVGGKTKVVWKCKEFIDEDGLGEWGSEIPSDPHSGIAASAHYNYVVALPDFNNIVAALSLSRSQVKKAKDFNYMLKQGTAPVFARRFRISTIDDRSDLGQYKNIKISPSGFVQDQAQFEFYRDIAQSITKAGYRVDQDDNEVAEAGDGKL